MQVGRIHLHPEYSISRVIKGGWHLAGGHGHIDEKNAIEDMRAFAAAGLTTFDCADIYTGVEELIGRFIKQYKDAMSSGALPSVQIHTKYVPDHDALATLDKKDTTRIIDRSLQRLGVERLDLVQFAWWDYNIPGYVETALDLAELQRQGKIRYIGTTNFDAAHLTEILDAGVPVIANQVQYSVLDHRPHLDMDQLSATHGMSYLCYGSLAGGFLSDRYLNVPDPAPPLENRSLVKYRLIIEEFGGYDLFQKALHVLRDIADKHGVGIAEIASQYILQRPMVAAVIIGARNSHHLKSIKKLSGFSLDKVDITAISAITDQASGPLGPVYDLERDKNGRHGAIMKYNLNHQRS